MRLFTANLNGWVHPADVFVALFEQEENSFWLDREHQQTDAYSVVGASTRVVDSLAQLQPLARDEEPELPFDFRPGLVGSINYEGESKFMFVDRAIVFDHKNKNLFLVGYFESHEDFEFWRRAAYLRLWLGGGQQAAYALAKSQNAQTTEAKLLISEAEYLEKISQAQHHIAKGDVYQLCLTNRIFLETSFDALATFLRLRSSNPAPYASYLKFGEQHIVSASPEQFLKVKQSGRVTTKPIKGTRRRGATAEEDSLIAAELKSNEKERAENLMIVDLMRNDLGRVSKPDSVSVTKLFDVESYSTVHQLVSTVEADLLENMSAIDAIEAAFPGGSMTGAPKLRAMQIIRELENAPRGVYSGAIGYLGHDGSAEFGMTIRTIEFQSGKATIGVGGGITSDSDPDAELEETKLKAKALLEVLAAPNPWA